MWFGLGFFLSDLLGEELVERGLFGGRRWEEEESGLRDEEEKNLPLNTIVVGGV